MAREINVEVVYALPQDERVIAMKVPEGTTAHEAVVMSGILDRVQEITLESAKIGIFGKTLSDPRRRRLAGGDRVEIYRPLIVDPKVARRMRARKRRES